MSRGARICIRLSSALVAAAVLATQASAEICPRLAQVIDSESTQRPRDDGTWPADWALFFADAVGAAERNRVNQGCDPNSVNDGHVACSWVFPLRDPEAQALYDDIKRVMTACLGTVAQIESDSGVNHPDTYLAQIISLKNARLVIALKDKAQLGKTFVTFRVFNRN